MSNFTTILLDEFTSPVSNVTKSLNCECFIFNTKFTSSSFIDESSEVQALSNGVIDTETSWLRSTMNTTLPDMFSSAASLRVNVILSSNTLVSVFDPGHYLFICSHIWT
jgi:hypothetical protein